MHYVYPETTSLDQRCYDMFELTPDLLMEHAGMGLAKEVKKKLLFQKKALFICGSGNNGADGIVAARILYGRFDVALYLPFGTTSTLANIQLARAKKCGVPVVEKLNDADVYIDALFGSGLNRPLNEQTCTLIEALNAKKGYKIACDIPSGILRDHTTNSTIFRADKTVVMGAYKECLFNDGVKDFVGSLNVVPLGISPMAYEVSNQTFLLQKKDLKLPFRVFKNTHKGEFGHVAILMGEKKGAAVLAGKGAFHFGAGLVSLIGDTPLKIPSYLMRTLILPHNCNVIVAGMGMDGLFDANVLETHLLSNALPLVIDASLCYHPLIKEIINSQKPIVLTPHPKEFSALLKLTCNEDIDTPSIQKNRFFHARRFSLLFPHLVLVLKGANTLIAHQGEIFINTFGTQALSKGGSGDVLSGMIGALIAQGYTLKDAAIHASLAHSLVSKKLTCNNFALTPNDIYKGLKCL